MRIAHDGVARGEFDYDTVIAAGEMLGKTIKKPSCRTQILGYKQRGFVEAVAPGVFRLTHKGLNAINDPNDEGPVSAGPSRISSGLAGSPGQHPTQVVRDGSSPSSSTSALLNGQVSIKAVSSERPPATESSHVKTY